jgi:hypothetical protein
VTITRVYDNIFNTLINYVTEGLIAEQTGVSYQWLDCENNYAIIPGEQEGLFSPSSNGTYSVMLTNASCSDTSSCIQVTNVGIKDGIGARGLLVYPNPTSNSLTIEFTENQEAVLIEVFDLSGSQILQLNEERGLFFTIDLGDNAIGSYFIHITTKEFSEVVEVLKR